MMTPPLKRPSCRPLPQRKRVALIAHDGRKAELVRWATTHKSILARHQLFGTGTTGQLVQQAVGLTVERFASGPLGGDQQIGAKIVEGAIDILLFFWDPLSAQPHDPDVKALLRVAALYEVPIACNVATADFLISSAHFDSAYDGAG